MQRSARWVPKGTLGRRFCAVTDRIVIRVSFDRLAEYLLFIGIVGAACLMPAQNDTWWQLRAGQDIWATARIDLRDHFSHTVAGSYWPNHEWLSQALFFGAYRTGGMPALTALCAAAVIAAWMLVWARVPMRSRTTTVWLALGVLGSTPAWTLRPQVFTLLLAAVTFVLLERERERWLPLIFVIWANLHGGVVLGFAILAGAIAYRVTLNRRVVPLLVVATLCAAATMVTPLGPSLWREVPASLARLRDYQVNEWRPPALTDLTTAPFWIVGGGVALVAVRTRLRRLPMIMWAAVALLPLALLSGRNISPFLLMGTPALATAAERPSEAHARREHYAFNFAMLALGGVAAVVVVAYSWARETSRLAWHPLSHDVVEALDRCPGPIYNRYDDGGYLIWFANRAVFLDSRQDPFPPALVHAQIAAERSGEYRSLFDRYAIRCAFVPATSLVSQRLEADGWRALYSGPTWAVLTTPDRYHMASSVQP